MLRKRPNKSSEVVRRRPRLSSLVLWLLNFVLPIAILLLVRSDLIALAVLTALVSKWRIFAVQPRHWLANLRSNAVDIAVKLSTVGFIVTAGSDVEQVLWTLWYIAWLVLIKPRSGIAWVGAQAWLALVLGLSAIFEFSDRIPELIVIILAWLIAVYSGRHFLNNYDEPYARPMTYLWGLIVAEFTWIAFRWSLKYVFLPQLAVVVGLLAYTAGSLYHLRQTGRLNRTVLLQQCAFACAILLVILIKSDWGGSGL